MRSQMMSPLLISASLLLTLQLSWALTATTELQCRDADGTPLDWFALLKQPESTEYAYVSSSRPSSWTQPDDSDLTKSGPVFATVSQALSGSPAAVSADVLAAYNDEPPPEVKKASNPLSNLISGHMKGLVALMAGQRGFWLIHSVPKFPDIDLDHYAYPNTGFKYGQSFLCLTVNSSAAAEDIGKQLFASHPDLYSIRVSATAAAAWPSWVELKQKKSPPASLLNSTVRLMTSGGLSVLHLAKSPHLKQDLYSYLLAGQLDSSIQVETWQHGERLLNSTCSRRYNVTKVLRVRIGSKQLAEFPSTSDHSKWCVTVGAASRPHVCIGDMNRAETQYQRGGGIACVGLPALHGLFKAAVLSDQACYRGNNGFRLQGQTLLVAMYNWAMVAALCAMACTMLSVGLLLWLALARIRWQQHGSVRPSSVSRSRGISSHVKAGLK